MAEITQEQVSSPGRPPKGGAKVIFIFLIVIALAGMIVYLLSLINSKKYFLAPEGSELVVKKGIFFPVGSEIYQPKDASQANLYLPIERPYDLKHSDEIVFEDLPSLNREFAKYLVKLSEEMIFSDDEVRYQKGKLYLERVGKLQGLDADQLSQIQALSADVDYIEAKHAYLGVEKILEKALKKFKQAETFGTGRFLDAREWIGKIQALLHAIKVTKASSAAQLTKESRLKSEPNKGTNSSNSNVIQQLPKLKPNSVEEQKESPDDPKKSTIQSSSKEI